MDGFNGYIGNKDCEICIIVDFSFSLSSTIPASLNASPQTAVRIDGYLESSAKNAAQAIIYLMSNN